MCIFFNFDHLNIKLQISKLIWSTKFRALLSPSLHSSPSSSKLLSMASYGGELLLDSSSPWSGVSSLSAFSILLPVIFPEAKESIDEEDPRPTSSNGAYISELDRSEFGITYLCMDKELGIWYGCHWKIEAFFCVRGRGGLEFCCGLHFGGGWFYCWLIQWRVSDPWERVCVVISLLNLKEDGHGLMCRVSALCNTTSRLLSW